jgi:hypothetical protein
MFRKKVVERINKHFLVSVIFFLENRALYETMWKNIVELDRPQMTIWCMRIACWIRKATYGHTTIICNTYCFSVQQWLQERA